MKKQIKPSVKAHLLPSLFILLSLLAIAVIPFAQAQRHATKQSVAKSKAAVSANAAALTKLSRDAAARPTVTGATGAGMLRRMPPPPKAPQVVLYDQYNNPGANATLSATFTDFPTFSADLADDFTVPAGPNWTVQSIDADGVYFNGTGPADSWNVFIYADAGGMPGATVYSILNTTVTVSGTTYTVNLSPCATLPPGTYWIEIQANMTFATRRRVGLDRPDGAIRCPGAMAKSRRRLRNLSHLDAKAGYVHNYRKRTRPGLPDQRDYKRCMFHTDADTYAVS